MTGYLNKVSDYLVAHYAEAAEGLVEKAPSRLCRGEGTEKNFYIIKIDLVNSTQLLLGRRRSTYLKLAHTFLSTIDRVACDHGADGQQTEYAGDSVLAYFPDSVPAREVLNAAFYCREAVRKIGALDQTLAGLRLQCKIVLHHAPLVVSRIGPRGGSVLTAIGYPIHTVAKMEKGTKPGGGQATTAFYSQLDRPNKLYLSACYLDAPAPLPAFNPAINDGILPRLGLAAALNPVIANGILTRSQGGLAAALSPATSRGITSFLKPIDVPGLMRQPPALPPPEPIKTVVGYTVNWGLLYRAFGIPLG